MISEKNLAVLGPDCPLDEVHALGLVSGALGLPAQEGFCEEVRLADGGACGLCLTTDAEDAESGPLSTDDDIVCAIGAFDGVHLGHRALIARAREEARRRGSRLVAVTFSPDPARVLGDADNNDLLLPDDRVRFLQTVGAETVCCLDFTRDLAGLSYERFVREVLCGLGHLRAIVVGSDFNLGARGAGNVSALTALGRKAGFDVIGMELKDSGGAPITATRIRGLLAEGGVEAAAGLLGRCHYVFGRVAHGRGEGTSFGFPTANVEVADGLLLPAEGVYAAYAVVDGKAWPAAVNVGRPRSFEPGREGAQFLEATLVGFEGDLYEETVAVVFVRWLREPKNFSTLGELEATVLANVSWVRDTLMGHGLAIGEALA